MTSAGGLPGAALRRVLQYIETNLHRDPKLTELSATVYMSAFHFARLFKLSTGVSPHRFVVGRRITYATQLLVEDGLSIAAISRVVGFRAPSHFTSTFRRVTGITPSTYRAQARAVPPPTPGGTDLRPCRASRIPAEIDRSPHSRSPVRRREDQ